METLALPRFLFFFLFENMYFIYSIYMCQHRNTRHWSTEHIALQNSAWYTRHMFTEQTSEFVSASALAVPFETDFFLVVSL